MCSFSRKNEILKLTLSKKQKVEERKEQKKKREKIKKQTKNNLEWKEKGISQYRRDDSI